MDHQFPRNQKYRNNGNNKSSDSYRSRDNQNHTNNDHEYNPTWHGKVTNFLANSSTYSESQTSLDPNDWTIDSACNVYLTPIKDRLTQYREFDSPREVLGLGGKKSTAIGIGNLTLEDQQG